MPFNSEHRPVRSWQSLNQLPMKVYQYAKILRIGACQPRPTESLGLTLWAHPSQVIAVKLEAMC